MQKKKQQKPAPILKKLIAKDCFKKFGAVIAFDVSLTSTGWCALTRTKFISGVIRRDEAHKKLSRYKNFTNTIDRARELVLDEIKADTVIIEGYSFASKGNTALSMTEIGGYLRGVLCEFGHLKVLEIAPTSWRLFVFGNGSVLDKDTKKDLSAHKRRKLIKSISFDFANKYVCECENDDASDAACMMYAFCTYDTFKNKAHEISYDEGIENG